MSWKVMLAQMDSKDNREENQAAAEKMIFQAADQGADLLIFPETVDYIGKNLKEHALDLTQGGSWQDFFAEKAKQYGMYLHGGSITEKNKEGKPYNTSLFFDPEGQLIAKYRKMHMFDVEVTDGPAYRESAGTTAGNEIVTVDTKLGKLGLSICYDLRFPELYRLQAMGGAKLLIVAANFTRATGAKHWEILLRARAIENGCYVLACNQCGEKEAFAAYGNSMIIGPDGSILARAGDEVTMISADIDLEEVEKVRQEIPSLANRREDVYHLGYSS